MSLLVTIAPAVCLWYSGEEKIRVVESTATSRHPAISLLYGGKTAVTGVTATKSKHSWAVRSLRRVRQALMGTGGQLRDPRGRSGQDPSSVNDEIWRGGLRWLHLQVPQCPLLLARQLLAKALCGCCFSGTRRGLLVSKDWGKKEEKEKEKNNKKRTSSRYAVSPASLKPS